ncbi:carboxypeptidase-like regulatory domain-containing protein, partial [Aquiflexum sp.]|uniref:carboxypeptidase-like regulatory domain-containing protein n=1 Tax=Aquiflexum sp. TaxID=1872584 RepID=UPI003593474F
MKRLKYFITVIFLIGIVVSDVIGQSYPVKGTILDSDSNDPLGFVQVAIFSLKDQTRPISFSDSDKDGLFSLDVPKGKYTFKAFFLGYKDFLLEEME